MSLRCNGLTGLDAALNCATCTSCSPSRDRAAWERRRRSSPSHSRRFQKRLPTPSTPSDCASLTAGRGELSRRSTVVLCSSGTAVFDELRQGVKELEFLTDPASGELRLGCTETMAAGFVSAVADRVSRAYPRVNVHLTPGDSVTLFNRELRQRTIDFAIGPVF